MATQLPINLISDNLENHDIFNAFHEPRTDTSIVKTTSIRAELLSQITRNSKEITLRIPAAVTNNFYRISKIKYVIKGE